ncbi:MAG: alanine racemase [bacterium]|nr:alanine racemase [bacterium]
MSTQKLSLKTWVEINRGAVRHNFRILKALLKPKTKIFAVVKSNAYGHGIFDFTKIVDSLGVYGFCVDSVIEAEKLRRERIKRPILVLGPTLPDLLNVVVNNDVTITISTWEALRALRQSKCKPSFHIKIDTGMRRQGFYVSDLPKVVEFLKSDGKNLKTKLVGVYTHFASAKDLNYPTFTDLQFHDFNKGVEILVEAGYKNLLRHAAATGGALVSDEYNLDAVRLGIGLYGLWPSKELEVQRKHEINLKPVLSWHALISEVKELAAGDYVGYDLVERVYENKKMAVVPIGYWHGFPRALSSVGEVLISGQRARVLGRVSMDLIVVDVTGIRCKAGDKATIIGRQREAEISSYELAQKTNTSHYEIVTRINPLIERIIK